MVNVDLDTSKDQVKETKGKAGTKRGLKLELSHDSTDDRIGMTSSSSWRFLLQKLSNRSKNIKTKV